MNSNSGLVLRCTLEEPYEVPLWKPPRPLAEFWEKAGGARLFEDVRFGQWGLVLFSPSGSLRATSRYRDERAGDAATGDLIVGEFLGDQELLLVRCDPGASDWGAVIRAENPLPSEPRAEDGFVRRASV